MPAVQLVAPRDRGLGEARAEDQSGVVGGVHPGSARSGHSRGAGEQVGDGCADEGGRHQAEDRERRVAAADVGWSGDDGAKSALVPDRLQWSAGVGDRHESVPRGRVRRRDGIPPEGKPRLRLDGRSRLARHDDEGLPRIDARQQAGDGGRVCAVEHGQRGAVRTVAEGGLKQLGGKAGSAHSEQNQVAAVHRPNLARQVLEPRRLGRHRRRQREPAESIDELGHGPGAPHGVVALPDPRRQAVAFPLGQTSGHGAGERAERQLGAKTVGGNRERIGTHAAHSSAAGRGRHKSLATRGFLRYYRTRSPAYSRP